MKRTDDFQQHADRIHRRARTIRMMFFVNLLIALSLIVAVLAAIAWLLLHPAAIGHFFGVLAASFKEAA